MGKIEVGVMPNVSPISIPFKLRFFVLLGISNLQMGGNP
jgi:hypothetical protein